MDELQKEIDVLIETRNEDGTDTKERCTYCKYLNVKGELLCSNCSHALEEHGLPIEHVIEELNKADEYTNEQLILSTKSPDGRGPRSVEGMEANYARKV